MLLLFTRIFLNKQQTAAVMVTIQSNLNSLQFFLRILDRGHIEKAMYSGWYSVQDETFVKESQIEERTDGSGNVVRVSAESGHVLEWTEEENYVFKLSR